MLMTAEEMVKKLNTFTCLGFFMAVFYILFVTALILIWIIPTGDDKDELALLILGVIIFLINTTTDLVFFKMSLNYVSILNGYEADFSSKCKMYTLFTSMLIISILGDSYSSIIVYIGAYYDQRFNNRSPDSCTEFNKVRFAFGWIELFM